MNRAHKKLERMMLFSEVARCLSFTVAAENLGISRGYLSDQVKKLEREMKVPLLIRSTRQVRLTKEGERVLEGMEHVQRSLLAVERSVQGDRHEMAGVIRVTAPHQFTERFLLDICHEFQQAHPEIHVSVDCSYTSRNLTESNFDLAFRATSSPPPNMVAKPLFSYRHICCASPDYISNFGSPKTAADLVEHRCLTGVESQYWQFRSADIDVKPFFAVNDNHMLRREALLGRGIIRVPEYLVDRDVLAGKLVHVLTDECVTGQTIYIIHPQLIHQSARLREFIKFAQKHISL